MDNLSLSFDNTIKQEHLYEYVALCQRIPIPINRVKNVRFSHLMWHVSIKNLIQLYHKYDTGLWYMWKIPDTLI